MKLPPYHSANTTTMFQGGGDGGEGGGGGGSNVGSLLTGLIAPLSASSSGVNNTQLIHN